MHGTWDYGMIELERTVAGTGVVDVGDIIAVKRRLKSGDDLGHLGIELVPLPEGRYSSIYRFEVRVIDPSGPAAKTELQVGDVVTSIDGIDISGPNVWYADTLLSAPAGTKLLLGLARGVTVPVILGPRTAP